MNQQEKKTAADLRPFGLTAALCILSIAAALDMEYGIAVIGLLLFAVMIGILAVILMTCEKYIFVLDAVSMLLILFFATGGSLETALLGAVLIACALIFSVFIRKKSDKTTAVLAVCISFAIGFGIVWAIFYAAEGGSLAPSELLSKLNDYFDSFKPPLADMVREYVDSLSAEVLAYYEKYEITKEMLLEAHLESMESAVDMAQMLLPGCFLFAVQALGYIGVISFEKTVKLCRYDALLPEARWLLYPTQVSCVVYLIVTTLYLITMFFSSSVFSIVVTNCWIALTPVMLACGLRSLGMRLKHPRFRRSTVFILVLFVAGIFFLAEAAIIFGIFMLTFMGAQDVSLARAAESAKANLGGKDRDDRF